MQIEKISISRMKAYEQCELMYDAVYNKGKEKHSDALTLGTLVHAALEEWHKNPKKDILQCFDYHWQKSNITNLDCYHDGREMLNNYIADPSNYQHPVAEDEEGKILERHFVIPLTDEVLFSGIIDRLDFINDDTVEIIDYKTNMVPYTRTEIDNDIQLTGYNLAVNYLWPQYSNVLLSLLFLRYQKLTTSRTPEQLEEFKYYTINTFYQIKLNDNPRPRLNSYCIYCPIHNDCPEFRNLTQGERMLFGDLPDAPDKILQELEDVTVKAKILNGRKKELEEALKAQIKGTGEDYIELASGKKVYLRPNRRSFYPYEVVERVLGRDKAMELASVSKAKVDAAVKKNPEARQILEQGKVEYFIEPNIEVS